MVLKTYDQVVREVQAEVRAMMPESRRGSLVDELIAERRDDARLENQEFERWLDR